jgi:hypothetical protein
MPDRLPWHCDPDGSYVAYPEGDEHPDCFARLERGGGSGSREVWEWLLGYGKARRFGIAHSREAAADAAADGWPSMQDEAEQLEEADKTKARLTCLIDEAIDSGDLGPLDVEHMPYQLLVEASHHLRQHLELRLAAGEETDRVEAVNAIISDELLARRQQGAE